MVASTTSSTGVKRGSTVTVKALAVHPNPHLEEWFAIWLLRNFGFRMFPGIRTAKLVFWPGGEGTPDGRPVAAHEAEGTLALGTALSSLDEHRKRRGNPSLITCSAQLVAEALGVDDDPALGAQLAYLSRIDSQGKTSTFDMANAVKLIQDPANGANPNDPHEVGYWCFRPFKAYYNAQRRFFEGSRVEWGNNAVVWEVRYPKQTYRIGEIHSAARDMQRVGRFWGKCDVVIQHGPRKPDCGNSQVYVNQKTRLPLSHWKHLMSRLGGYALRDLGDQIMGLINHVLPHGLDEARAAADFVKGQFRPQSVHWLVAEVCRLFRLAELRTRNINVNALDPRLWSEEDLRDCPQFFLHRKPGWLFNGALSATQVPQSCIPIRPTRAGDPSPWVKLVYYALVSPWNREVVKLTRSTPFPQAATKLPAQQPATAKVG